MLYQKNIMQIKAKELNTYQSFETLMILLLCVFSFLLLSNINLIISVLTNHFAWAHVLKDKYLQLAVSIITLVITIPILARFRAIREIWFLLKTKSEDGFSYSIVKQIVKRIGFFRYLNLYVQLWIRNILWFCLLVSPASIMIKLWIESVLEANATTTITVLMAIGTVVLLFVSINSYLMIKQKYAMCYWLLMERDDISANQVIKESARLMDLHCADLFWYKFRLAGWMLLCVVFFPAIIYVYPYFKHANAVYVLSAFYNGFYDENRL